MKAVNHFVRNVLAIVLLCYFSLANAEVITENRTIEADDLSLENLDVVVDGVTLTINGAHSLGSLDLKNGAVLTHSVEAASKLDLTVGGRVLIDGSSAINVVARGQAKPSGIDDLVGGSYGGRGGFYNTNQSVEEYGSYTSPFDYGIGADDRRGGGAVKLTAEELVLDGSITANGSGTSGYGGGSSGGSIWLRLNKLSGAGSITANGGDVSASYSGSGGGGGRVAIYYQTNEGFDFGNVTALGGKKDGSWLSESGAAGTVYRFDQSSRSGALSVVGQDRSGRTTVIAGESDELATVLVRKAQAEFRAEDIAPGREVLVDDGRLFLSGAHTFGSLDLVNGSVLTHRVEVEKKLDVTVTGTVSIDESSSVNVDARGQSKPSGVYDDVGGSYGGRGGFYNTNQSVEEFGSYTSPLDYGIGAGDESRGGGAVKLTAEELVLDGSITANGSGGDSRRGKGGSSGGSIWLRLNKLSGAGSITANGGSASPEDSGSGGGGGRVAIYYQTSDGFDFGNVTALGGKNSGSSDYRSYESGAAGTVYRFDQSSRSGMLSVVGQDRSGRTTVVAGESEELVTVLVRKAQAEFRAENIAPGGEVLVDDGRLFLNGAHTFGSLDLVNGGVLSHPVEVEKKLDVTVTGAVSIDESSSVNVAAQGQATPPGAYYLVGGSYGGRGGFYSGNQSVEEFGSYTSPFDYGTGAYDRRGGGVIKLTAEELVLDGLITANGSDAIENGGGSSGGSIWLRLNKLSGAGSITANGGNVSSSYNGSGGGGGRVAIYYLNKSEFTPTAVSTAGGSAGRTSSSTPGEDGTVYWGQSQLPTKIISTQPASGKITRNQISSIQVEFLTSIDAASFSTEDVTLTGPNGSEDVIGIGTTDSRTFSVNLPTPLLSAGLYSLQVGPDITGNTGLPMDQNDNGVGGEATADQFTATFKLEIADVVVEEDLFISESDPSYRDKVIVVENGTLTVDGSYDFKTVHLKPGTSLTGVKAQQASDPTATWQFESLIVEEGASIDVSGLGLPPTEEVGLHSAGSYGGTGSTIWEGKTNQVFGNQFEPEDYGIGGRGISDEHLSFGGGALKLIVGQLELDGDIRADGGFSATDEAGASGGSIWIETDLLEGTGKISADGSRGDLYGSSGGGGRISLTYREAHGFNFDEQLSAVGGEPGANGNGSIYVHRSDHSTSVRNIHLEPITVDASGRIAVEFSEELDMSTFTSDDVQMTDGDGENVPVFSVGKEGDGRFNRSGQHNAHW